MPVQDYDPTTDGYGSKYVRGADFTEGPEVLLILDVNRVSFDRDGKNERKYELTFSDDRRATVNKRNYARFVEKWGDDPNKWIGRTVMCMAGDKFNGNISLIMLPQPEQTKLKPPRRPAPAAPATADNPFDDEDGTDTGEVPF